MNFFLGDLVNCIKSIVLSILRSMFRFCKITEQEFLFKCRWYRKLKGGHYILVNVYGSKVWYRNNDCIDAKRIIKEENYESNSDNDI